MIEKYVAYVTKLRFIAAEEFTVRKWGNIYSLHIKSMQSEPALKTREKKKIWTTTSFKILS